jgi:hypothetical protein
MAMEQALSGQRSASFALASGLSQLPDAPLEALLLSELLSQGLPPLPAPPATTSKPAFDRGAEIEKRLADMAKDPSNAAALADAAGTELTLVTHPGPNTQAWIDAYAKLVDPSDATLARLNGWMALRQGKLDEAQAALEKIAAADPLAQIGLAHILILQKKADAARDILQKLWNENPHGLLALQVAVAASTNNIMLADAVSASALRTTIRPLTPGLSGMHRQPRDAELISVYLKKSSAPVGEPVMLQIRMINAGQRALPVGADGMVKTMIGIAATARGTGSTPLGICSLEDVQRTYRLEPQQVVDTTLRVDQGKLGDLLQQNPATGFIVSVTAITAPRLLGGDQFSPGAGGMAVTAEDFLRGRLPLENAADFEKLADQLASQTGDKQLILIEAAAAVYGRRTDDIVGKLGATLKDLAASKDSLVKASLVRAMPALPADSELGNALHSLAADADPLVRLAWAERESDTVLAGKESAAAARAALEKQLAVEKDDLVKEWITLSLSAPAASQPQGN